MYVHEELRHNQDTDQLEVLALVCSVQVSTVQYSTVQYSENMKCQLAIVSTLSCSRYEGVCSQVGIVEYDCRG